MTDLIGEECDDSKLQETTNDKLFAYGGELPEHSEPSKPQKESLAGKKISFMGDSISTFEGWNNNAQHNSTLADNRVYYNASDNPKWQNWLSVNETWWKRTVDKLGLSHCVNNSYSGSQVTSGGSYPNETGNGSRAENLHNDITDVIPDIIVIYMGTNDYQNQINIDTFYDNYAAMIQKIKDKYPDADIYLCKLHNYDYVTAGKAIAPVVYNEKIEAIAANYGCNLVDFYNGTGVTPENLEYYTVDLLIDRNDISLVHPNAAGMGKMYECLKDALAQNYTIVEAEKKSYTVKVENSSIIVGEYSSVVNEGDAFEVSLNNHASMITVTMSGNKINSYDSSSGKIIIPYVTGDIVITAEAPEWLSYLNKLPSEFDSTTNLYLMEGIITREGYYNTSNVWDAQRTDVISAIFPVSEGMKIKSSSFVHVSGSNKGTYIAWFMADGSRKIVEGPYVYAQQTNNGWVTVPEGVVAVSMVWRIACTEDDSCGDNYMYIDQN